MCIKVIGWTESHLHKAYMILYGNEVIEWNLSFHEAVIYCAFNRLLVAREQ